MLNSPVLNAASEGSSDSADQEVGQLAKEDPLATQVWKMYAKTKAGLPNQQRMENLTWRMMALALKKKEKEEKEREEEEARAHELQRNGADDAKPVQDERKDLDRSASSEDQKPEQQSEETGRGERGRRIDKGKPRVRVVGFDGATLGGEDTECVLLHISCLNRACLANRTSYPLRQINLYRDPLFGITSRLCFTNS